MKNGEPFSYYKAWEHVRSVEFDGIKIPDGDYILVVKNEGEGMRWISAKIVNKRNSQHRIESSAKTSNSTFPIPSIHASM